MEESVVKVGKVGNPSKCSGFLEAVRCVIDTEHPVGYAVMFTDKDLVEMANDMLPEGRRISKRTFERYKAGEIVEDSGVIAEFFAYYERALRVQRANILRCLVEDGAGLWQKWAWLAERKFDDLNLRQRVIDETPDVGKLVLRVRE